MTENIPPILFQWDGEHMTPVNARRADQYYVVGEYYRLVPHEDRSMRSHQHFFAALHDAWDNLPLEMAALYPTVEHFRKHLLIKTGYRHERIVAAENKSEARKIAAIVRSMDQFAVASVRDNIVVIWTAESQSVRAMKKQRFQQSKDAVLNEAAAMIGVSTEQLRNQAAPVTDQGGRVIEPLDVG